MKNSFEEETTSPIKEESGKEETTPLIKEESVQEESQEIIYVTEEFIENKIELTEPVKTDINEDILAISVKQTDLAKSEVTEADLAEEETENKPDIFADKASKNVAE